MRRPAASAQAAITGEARIQASRNPLFVPLNNANWRFETKSSQDTRYFLIYRITLSQTGFQWEWMKFLALLDLFAELPWNRGERSLLL